jgi:hypothetical protein
MPAVIQYLDQDQDDTALEVEIYDEWVVAVIEGADGTHRHYIPADRIYRIVGDTASDDITLATE